jgi:hypothetical protein
MFSLDSNVKFYFHINFEIKVSPTVTTKFSKLPKLILFVKKHVFNMQIRNNIGTPFFILVSGLWEIFTCQVEFRDF